MTNFTRCILHAGTHKTGTTSVQQILTAHRSVLASSGFLYPAMGKKGTDHNPLAHTLAVCPDADLAQVREDLITQLNTMSQGAEAAQLILSAEEFSTRICNPHPWQGFDDGLYWDNRRRYLSRLRQVLPDVGETDVFLCFRDHETYAHSLYATKILSGKIDSTFQQFITRCAPIFNYSRQIELFADVFKKINIECYDNLQEDLENRFFSWLGIPIKVQGAQRLNATPSLELIHWLASAIQSSSGKEERKLRAEFCRSFVSENQASQNSAKSLWKSEQEREDFLRLCSAPPIAGWLARTKSDDVVNPAALDLRLEEIEATYRRWRKRNHTARKRWIFF